MTIDIVYEDNHLLVVNKPPGLLSQADATGDPDVVNLGKAYLKDRYDKPGNVFLGLVHRLDRPASGLMVLARTSKAAARLSEQFRRRTPSKRYVAMVENRPELTGPLVDYLRKDDTGRVAVVAPDVAGAKKAEMRAHLIHSLEWRSRLTSLMAIDLGTGRSHQIRVQLAHRGYPIVGDVRYGAQLEFDGRNLALHAWQLSVEHPTRKDRLTWSALPQADWGPYRAALHDLVTS